MLPFEDHFVVAAVVNDIGHTEILFCRTLHGISQKDGPGVTGNVRVPVSTYLTEPPLWNKVWYIRFNTYKDNVTAISFWLPNVTLFLYNKQYENVEGACEYFLFFNGDFLNFMRSSSLLVGKVAYFKIQFWSRNDFNKVLEVQEGGLQRWGRNNGVLKQNKHKPLVLS